MADRMIGAIDVSPERQIRLTLTTERDGAQVIDVRWFDRFAGVWMPGKVGCPIPVQHGEAFARLAAEAVAAGGGA